MNGRNTANFESKPIPLVLILSAVIVSALVWLIYFKGRVAGPGWITDLPAANATFNSLSAICLVMGYRNIRRGNQLAHSRFMLAATAFSACFLTSYIVYHYFHGDTRFLGHGFIRPIYFFILITHIGLSTIALPFILMTLWWALRNRFRLHRGVARITFPIWLYVSVTGVIVFAMLKIYNG